ncbi:MAG: hypothetical protein GX081_05765 [Firmicutes bacterium]|nr:hypothetical protein [Bacillota bacterium]
MLDYNNTTTVFLWVLAFYFLPMLISILVERKKLISSTRMVEIGKKFVDPITRKIHNWLNKYKLASIQKGNWWFLCLLIFLNNLCLGAFVSRIIYGIIFIIPLFLTVWDGFGHGKVFSNPRVRTGLVLWFFEFGGYLFATAIGVKLGINIFVSIIKGNKVIIDVPWNYVVLMVLFLFTGAALETVLVKVASKNMDLRRIDQFDFEKQRKELAKQLDEDWKGRQFMQEK